MALSDAEMAALAGIRQAFERPATLTSPGFSPVMTSAIHVEADADLGRMEAFEFWTGDLSRRPARGDMIDSNGALWVIVDVTERRSVDAWIADVVSVDRFEGMVVVERGVAVDDGYSSSDTLAWSEYFRGVAGVHFGSGSERREAARVTSVVSATFTLEWGDVVTGIRAGDRLRYPVPASDYTSAPIWNIMSALPTKILDQFEVTAIRQAD